MDKGISSGVVPRELVPGVVWDEVAERSFLDHAEKFLSRKPFSNRALEPAFDFEKSAIREAVWIVEIKLHQAFIKSRFEEARYCLTPVAKKRLVEKWSGLYGRARTDRLIRMLRSVELRKTVMEKW